MNESEIDTTLFRVLVLKLLLMILQRLLHPISPGYQPRERRMVEDFNEVKDQVNNYISAIAEREEHDHE